LYWNSGHSSQEKWFGEPAFNVHSKLSCILEIVTHFCSK